MIVSLHPQHVSFPRTSERQICGTVIPWSTFPTSPPSGRSRTRGQAGIWDYPTERRCGWSLVLPTASSFRLSPANFPMLSILPYLSREVVSFPSPGGEGWVQSRTGEAHSRCGGGHHLLLLLHILAQIPWPEQWTTS